MNRFLLITIILTSFFNQLASQNSTTGVPKIVIGIVVENMRPDYIDRYWNHFGGGGFRKLFTQGTSFSGVRMDQFIQCNASGTATLFTGVTPSVHGIIDNFWFDREKNVLKNCVADNYYTVTGTEVKKDGSSPSGLQVFTIAEQLKLSTGGKAKVYSIAMHAAPAVFSCGFSGDAAFWFDDESGNMVTSSYYLKQLPGWAVKFNQERIAHQYASGKWELHRPRQEYRESLADNDSLETGFGPGRNTFPHDIKEMVKMAGDYSPLKTTPFANSVIRKFMLDLLENEEIGSDQYPDLVTLFFSSMDKELNAFGPMSVETEDLYLRMDEEIATIVSFAEKRYGPGNLLVFLTSNVSASYPVDYLRHRFRIPAYHFNQENTYALLNTYLNFTFGDLRWIQYFNGSQVYLNHKLIGFNKIDLKEIREKTAGFLMQFEGIKLAVTADQIEQGQLPAELLDGIDKNYTPNRSGDVLYMLKEGWQPATKNSKGNYTDQRLIPMVFYGSGITERKINISYQATDFAPTLSAILKIPRPEKSPGRIMDGF